MNDRIDTYTILCGLSDYIPVMTEAEIVLILNGRMRVSPEMVYRWERLLQSRAISIETRVREAYAKQGKR